MGENSAPHPDDQVLNAHANKDHRALVRYYSNFAEENERSNNIDEACFFYTQAYVFALQVGMNETEYLHSRLKIHGREI